MKKVIINGIKFEIDCKAPISEAVYCRTYDVFGELLESRFIQTHSGSKAVTVFDVPWWGEIAVSINDETIYTPMWEVV